MNKWLARLLVAGAIILALTLGMAGGVVLDRQVLSTYFPLGNVPAAAVPDFRLIAEAWNTIQRIYVDRSSVKPQEMVYGAISGMVDSLGDTGHSRFLTPDMVKEESQQMQGAFDGIGAEVQVKDGQIIIAAPLDDSPAQRAGLQPGDVIQKVNGQDVAGLPLSQVVQRILGPAGTTVTLTILTPDTRQVRDVTLTRARIQLQTVKWAWLPGTHIAHVRIAEFSQGVGAKLRQALIQVENEHPDGLVLDLRNNPGGLLDESVNAASEFLKDGNVLLEKDAQGHVTQVAVHPGGQATDTPMVVLINDGTASASEIVAGALQDAHRATLVGTKTFGTGTVLGTFNLSDGSAIMLAMEEWLTPSGRVIWHQGIQPDQTVALAPNVTPLLPEQEQGMTADQLHASGDQQVLRAMDLLTKVVQK